jgi:phage terminase small subunit
MSDAQLIVNSNLLRQHKSAATEADPDHGLTNRQWKFVQHYVSLPNGTQAAIDAGYSVKSAAEQASLLLSNAKIKSAIDRQLAVAAERCAVTTDSVLRGLVRESTYAGPGASHAARVRALELLGKTLSMFTDQTAIIGPDGRPVDRFAPVFLQVIRNG